MTQRLIISVVPWPSRRRTAPSRRVCSACWSLPNRRDRAIEAVRSWRKAEPNDPLLARLEGRLLVAAPGGQPAADAIALENWPASASGSKPVQDESKKPSTGTTLPNRDLALLAASLGRADAAAWLTNRASLGQDKITAAGLSAVVASQGHAEEAIELQRLVPSDDAEDMAQLVQELFLAGRRAEAELLVMPRIQQKSPDLYGRLKRMTSAYYKRYGLDRLSIAAAAAAFAGNHDPSRTNEFANDLSYVWSDSDVNLPQALDLARIAVASDPTSAAYLDTYGWVYYKMGRFDEALSWLQRATSIPTEGADPVLFSHLGDTLWRCGKHGEAISAWQRSVELYGEQLSDGVATARSVCRGAKPSSAGSRMPRTTSSRKSPFRL